MGKVQFRPHAKMPLFRKVAMGTWRAAKDPSVYGFIEIDMTAVQRSLPTYSEKHQVKITPAHLVGKAVARCLRLRPEMNAMIRGSRIFLREHVALFYQVNVPGEARNKAPDTSMPHDQVKEANLSGAVIHAADELSTAEIAKRLRSKALDIRSGQEKELKRNMAVFKYLPWSLTGIYLNFVSWLIYGLNINLKWLGVPQDPFGSVMITNIGSMGIEVAWAPLCPYTRVPLLLAVGAVTPKAQVVDGQIVVREMLPIGITFDHRLIDGVHAAHMAAEFKKCFAEPDKYLFD